MHRVSYVGLSYVSRFENDGWELYPSCGLGPVFYTTTAESEMTKITLTHLALGFHYGISGERRISKTLGVGAKISLTLGSAKISSSEDCLSTSHFMITGFLSFRTRSR